MFIFANLLVLGDVATGRQAIVQYQSHSFLFVSGLELIMVIVTRTLLIDARACGPGYYEAQNQDFEKEIATTLDSRFEGRYNQKERRYEHRYSQMRLTNTERRQIRRQIRQIPRLPVSGP